MIAFADLNTEILASTLQTAAYDFVIETDGMIYVRSE